eukprot:365588-Chlamydomonas_euryale.AAC.7
MVLCVMLVVGQHEGVELIASGKASLAVTVSMGCMLQRWGCCIGCNAPLSPTNPPYFPPSLPNPESTEAAPSFLPGQRPGQPPHTPPPPAHTTSTLETLNTSPHLSCRGSPFTSSRPTPRRTSLWRAFIYQQSIKSLQINPPPWAPAHPPGQRPNQCPFGRPPFITETCPASSPPAFGRLPSHSIHPSIPTWLWTPLPLEACLARPETPPASLANPKTSPASLATPRAAPCKIELQLNLSVQLIDGTDQVKLELRLSVGGGESGVF